MVERAIYPWLVVSQLVPIPAIAPIFVIWFGFDLRPKILVVALGQLLPDRRSTRSTACKAVEPELLNLHAHARRRRWQHLPARAQLPARCRSSSPGCKIARRARGDRRRLRRVGRAPSEGLGYLILTFNNQTATAEIFAVVVVLAMIGIGLFALITPDRAAAAALVPRRPQVDTPL